MNNIERSRYVLSPEQVKISPIEGAVNAYKRITNEMVDHPSDFQQKSAIALAIMINDPSNLKELISEWGVNSTQVSRYITSAYENPVINELGNRVFDAWNIDTLKNRSINDSSLSVQQEITLLTQAEKDNLLRSSRSPYRVQILDMRMAGKTNKEISDVLQIPESTIKTLIVFIRDKFDPFLNELEIKPVTSYSENNILKQAASRGKLDAYKFLGIYYTRDKHVEDYEKNHRRKIDTYLLHNGFVILSLNTSKKEYDTFKLNKQYQKYIVRKSGIIYIKLNDLQTCREIYMPNS